MWLGITCVLPGLPGEPGNGGNISRDWRRFKEIQEATTTHGGGRGSVRIGGIRETKRIADYAVIKSIPTAVHCCVSPLGAIADVHAIATIRDFIALERDNVYFDLPWWQDLVTGIPKPIIQNGYIPVPDKPGLSVELNDEVVKQHLRVPGYFEPTPQCDKHILDDYRPGGAVK